MPVSRRLTPAQLRTLVSSVFRPGEEDKVLAILVDVPGGTAPDSDAWRDRRVIAFEWKSALHEVRRELGLEQIRLFAYPNVGSNNAELPAMLAEVDGDPSRLDVAALQLSGRPVPLEKVLGETQLLLAPTEFSTTAPLKLLAKKYRFRAATLPGFSRAMLPALGLDYEKVHRRVGDFKQRLDQAEGASFEFGVRGAVYRLELDLRFRLAHSSSGLLREMHAAGNLPSGEAYIVPHEGEREPSTTRGELPVQFGDEVVVFSVENNRAFAARPHDLARTAMAAREAQALKDEPAYGNLAELGIGVLGEFGITACGSTLLDEKLGVHLAFGRSDHFGGVTSPREFHDPKRVIHIDWVFVPSVQPLVSLRRVQLRYPGGRAESIVEDDRYVV